MMKKRSRIILEIVVVFCVLATLVAVMVPRFLDAQYRMRYAELDRALFILVDALVKDNSKIELLRDSEKGLWSSSHHITITGPVGGGNVRVNTMPQQSGLLSPKDFHSKGVSIAYNKIKRLLPDVALPGISIDSETGGPSIQLFLTYHDKDKDSSELVHFGVHTKLFSTLYAGSNPWGPLSINPPDIFVNDKGYFQPLTGKEQIKYFYHPSNGLESAGVLYKDSYSVGWRVRADAGVNDITNMDLVDRINPMRQFIYEASKQTGK